MSGDIKKGKGEDWGRVMRVGKVVSDWEEEKVSRGRGREGVFWD